MFRYIIFILLFNTMCLADKYYLNKYSRNEAIDTIIMKRELPDVDSTKKDQTNTFHQEPTNITNKIVTENKNKPITDANLTNDNNIPNSIKINNEEHSKDPWAAALRGFYVFLGLSIIIIVYFIIKSFRLRPGAAPPAIVRKYGIVGRRSDMEMLPLPLVEEDDDDTVFDMGTQINR